MPSPVQNATACLSSQCMNAVADIYRMWESNATENPKLGKKLPSFLTLFHVTCTPYDLVKFKTVNALVEFHSKYLPQIIGRVPFGCYILRIAIIKAKSLSSVDSGTSIAKYFGDPKHQMKFYNLYKSAY